MPLFDRALCDDVLCMFCIALRSHDECGAANRPKQVARKYNGGHFTNSTRSSINRGARHHAEYAGRHCFVCSTAASDSSCSNERQSGSNFARNICACS